MEQQAHKKRKTGNAPYTLLSCRLCESKNKLNEQDYEYERDKRFPWAVSISCPDPKHSSWIVCCECERMKTKITKMTQLKAHHKKFHNAKKEKERNAPASSNKSHAESIIEDTTSEKYDKYATEVTDLNFSTIECNTYFDQERKGLGKSYLAAYSHFHLKDISSRLNTADVTLDMKMSYLVSQMTHNQRELFTDIIDCVIKKERNHPTLLCPKCNLYTRTKMKSIYETDVPTTLKMMRKRYLEGKYAINSNLPIPKIHELEDHAYISPIDVIRDIMGHGLPLDEIKAITHEKQQVTKISESQRAIEIYQNFLQRFPDDSSAISIWINEWSDDMDPMDSIKSNRNSVWIKTITVSPPHGKREKLHLYTYPIAIGLKKSCHEEVEEKFAADLKLLCKGTELGLFYSAAHGKNINLHAEIFATLQDQPERRSANFISLGNSKYTSRFGYAVDLCAVASGIPACDNCLHSILLNKNKIDMKNNRGCNRCLMWTMDLNSGKLDFPPPKDYPVKELPSTGKLRPIKMSYSSMSKAVETAHNKLVERSWTTGNAETFLKVNGLNSTITKDVIENAWNIIIYKDAEEKKEEDPVTFEMLSKEKEKHPSRFECLKLPSYWSRQSKLDHHIDVIMHLLLLGIQKTLMKTIKSWQTTSGVQASFFRHTKGMLESIQDLNLSWCKTVPYKEGKLGGWVSENYLAMARLNKWFYASLDMMKMDDTIKELEVINKNNWRKRHYVAWFSIRRLDSTGNLDSLKRRLKYYLDLPQGPPEPVAVFTTPLHILKLSVQSLSGMIAYILVREVNGGIIDEVERRIKIFLTYFDRFDKCCGNSNKTEMEENMLEKTTEDCDIAKVDLGFQLTNNGQVEIAKLFGMENLGDEAKQEGNMNRSFQRNAFSKTPSWITSSNFMCLLNIPSAMEKFGPLINLWEGSYQGEGYLRIAKKHLKTGVRKNWMINAMRKIMRDKAYQNIMGNEYSETNISENIDEEDDEDKSTNFYSYKSRVDVLDDFASGRPISIVQKKNGDFGIIMGNGQVILKILHVKFVESLNGLHYHEWKMAPSTVETEVMFNVEIIQYCILLPRFAISNEIAHQNHFALITHKWMEMNELGDIQLPALPIE